MTKPKVSVIIPVYGVEKYISDCVVSLMEQTLGDVEFIFVDDCTSDNSVEIIRNTVNKYPHRIPNVRIVSNSTNSGVNFSRFRGLEISSGEYILMVDSDDTLEPNMIESMLDAMIHNNSDMVICDFNQIEKDTKSHYKCYDSKDLESEIETMLEYRHMRGMLWNKMFRKEFILTHSIIFPQNHMMEDWAVSIQCMLSSPKITYIPEPLYNYYIRNNSRLSDNSEEAAISKFIAARDNVKFIEQLLIKNHRYHLHRKSITTTKVMLRNLLNPYCSTSNKALNLWLNSFDNISLDLIRYGKFTIITKLGLIRQTIRNFFRAKVF